MNKKQTESHIKGLEAEDLIAKMSSDAYFRDFTFKNPYLGQGKEQKELCDVLTILGDVAIVWQIKNVKLGQDGAFREQDLKKAIRQCRGAKRRLLREREVTLENLDGVSKTIDVTQIREVFLIAPIEGGVPEAAPYYDDSDVSAPVHLLYETATRFAIKHFNTVSDLVGYLRSKQELLTNKSVLIQGGEEDLMARYISNNRSFEGLGSEDATLVVLDTEGAADRLIANESYQAKRAADDTFSPAFDKLIEAKRAAIERDSPSSSTQADRDKFLARMMSHDRFERRILGRTFMDAAATAGTQDPSKGDIYRRYVPVDDAGVTYVFAFAGQPGEDPTRRRDMLHLAALAARRRFPQNSMVIAVATEKDIVVRPIHPTFDWVMFDLTEEEARSIINDETAKLLTDAGFLKKPDMQHFTAYEYPDDMQRDSDNETKVSRE